MKWKKISLIALLFLFAVTGINAQNKPDSIRTETQDERGDLYQLTQRAYIAFTAYTSGSTKLYEGYERPIIAIYKKGMKEFEYKVISDENLKRISIDEVKSIEVVYNPEYNGIYGIRALTCIIKITLK